MKVVMLSEERLKELVHRTLNDIFRSPDASKMEEKVDHRTVNYHLCLLQESILKAALA